MQRPFLLDSPSVYLIGITNLTCAKLNYCFFFLGNISVLGSPISVYGALLTQLLKQKPRNYPRFLSFLHLPIQLIQSLSGSNSVCSQNLNTFQHLCCSDFIYPYLSLKCFSNLFPRSLLLPLPPQSILQWKEEVFESVSQILSFPCLKHTENKAQVPHVGLQESKSRVDILLALGQISTPTSRLFLSIAFYSNTPVPIYLWIIYGHFAITRQGCGVTTEVVWPIRLKIVTVWPF